MTPESVKQAIAAAIAVTNDWLGSDDSIVPQPHNFRVATVTASSAAHLSAQFTQEDVERLVDWDWENIFHQNVKHAPKRWMFSVVSDREVGAVCYGQIKINVDAQYVSIEYLERFPAADELKGYATLIAIHFIQVLASTLEIPQLRIANPLESVVGFYRDYCGFLSHLDRSGKVDYMYTEVANG